MIEADTSDLQAAILRLERAAKNGPQEIRRVLVSVQRATKSFAVRQVLLRYNVKRPSVDSRTKVSAVDATGFTLTAANQPISLVSFGAKQLGEGLIRTRGYGSGVSVKVEKKGGATVLNRAFIARAAPAVNADGQTRLVYERRTEAGKRGGKLRALYGPAVGAVHQKPEFQKELSEFFNDRAGRVVAQRTARVIAANGR